MSDPGDEGAVRQAGGSARRLDAETVGTYLRWSGLAAFALLAVVAGVGLYTSIGAVIDVWIGDRFQPIARAVFNLVVLCVAAIGVVALLRRR